MPRKYDVIVIGAGIGGLTAAAILSRNGKRVLVLERNPVVGGYAVNFRRGDFEFDASLHMICGCDEGGVTYDILRQCGVIDKVKLLKPRYLYRAIFPDFDIRVPQNNPQEYINILTKNFPSERKGIERLFNEMSKLYYEVISFLYSKPAVGIQMLYLPIKYPRLFLYATKSLGEVLDNFLQDNRLKTIISQPCGYCGLPPSKLDFAYFSYPWHDYLYNGGHYPKGGSQALSNAFAEAIQENNGEVMLNRKVEKIIMKGILAKGVITKDKEEFFGDTIISNIDANKTFFNLITEEYLPKTFTKRLNKMEPSISALQIYLGLNIDLKDRGILDYEVFYNPNYDFESQYRNFIEHSNMDKVSYIATLYSNIQPDIAPAGKSLIGITTLSGYDFWRGLSKEKYKQAKQQSADILIKRAEEIIPNLSSSIEEISISTPLTMERYTGNCNGALYGFSQIVSQSGINRLNAKTPIKNIYLASAWTLPGGGAAGAMLAGRRTAEQILSLCSPHK